jgi:hypothetical protein
MSVLTCFIGFADYTTRSLYYAMPLGVSDTLRNTLCTPGQSNHEEKPKTKREITGFWQSSIEREMQDKKTDPNAIAMPA